ncbi:MAG: site-specific integrase [Cyanothece sp. SIO1E1]|nr:site-specific integrase [Cyanothece sp. SIO1E1]
MIDEFDTIIASAQNRLKAAKTRVSIRRKGNALFLRATLPPKPDSGHVKPRRYELKTGLPVSRDGIRRAEAEAKHLGALLALKQFDWSVWLGEKPPEDRTIGEWIGEFKQHYMGTHSLTEMTWQRHWQSVYNVLPQDEKLTVGLVVSTALGTLPDTRKRREYCNKLQKLVDHAGIDINLKPYQGKYNSSKPQNSRDLPTDATVSEWRGRIPNKAWRWFYSIVATFGLRPHEAWFCKFVDDLTLQVTEGKTGSRIVQALYPEWVERWGLQTIVRPKITAKVYREYGERASHQFARYCVPFGPYDLRHAWAIRSSITFKLPDTIAARMMGHSVEVHHRTYHRWLSQAKQADVYQAAIRVGPKAPE